jgi:hypothetical protein
MKAQSKITTRRDSAKDREFDQLLRRAALYLKAQAAGNARMARRKRSKAA